MVKLSNKHQHTGNDSDAELDQFFTTNLPALLGDPRNASFTSAKGSFTAKGKGLGKGLGNGSITDASSINQALKSFTQAQNDPKLAKQLANAAAQHGSFLALSPYPPVVAEAQNSKTSRPGSRTSRTGSGFWPFNRGQNQPVQKKIVKKVLILMSNTGGGHKASAEAIRDTFKELYGDRYEISIVDLWKEHTPWPFNTLCDSYPFMVKHSLLWKLSYEVTNPRTFHIPYLGFLGFCMHSWLNQAFDYYQPDLVVSVHPLMQHVPLQVLRHRIQTGLMRPINFATVVTDFTTCHNTWFHKGATRTFVATEYANMLGRKNGLEDDQIHQYGLPIRPVFSKGVKPRKQLRKHLGIDQRLPAVLVIGGGEGMGALEETVSQLDEKLGDSAQAVVICGRNRKLLQRLEGKQQPNGLVVHARGFVDNIHEWMAACDAIITKAGPGTIAEALVSGLPILLNGNIPCQEEGNIPYVIDNGVGDFETRPAEVATIVQRWLLPETNEEKKHVEQMRTRAKQLGRPEAVYEIVKDLAKLADEPDFHHGPAKAVFGKQWLKRSTEQLQQQQQQLVSQGEQMLVA